LHALRERTGHPETGQPYLAGQPHGQSQRDGLLDRVVLDLRLLRRGLDEVERGRHRSLIERAGRRRSS
jgi:hypothetical protein